MERLLAMKAQPRRAVPFMRHGASLHRRHSFTLVELLVVLAIIALLSALALPAIRSALESDGLSAGAQEVADQVSLARQLSSSRNVTVEMRVFKMYGTNGSYTGGNYLNGYTAIQSGTYTSTGTWQATTRLLRLPQNIAIAENANVSAAFSSFSAPFTNALAGESYNALYYPFEFRPSGIVTPVATMTNYCLTVLPTRYAQQTTITGIKNYAVVQINPTTGTPLIFRP